ncbi:MAG: hypothetical protein ACOWYE_05985 [Desulfatiglandales bacterium]
MMAFTAFIILEDQRKEDWASFESPQFFCATFKWPKDPHGEGGHELGILDHSAQGLALFLPKEKRRLFEDLEPGDRISEITLFAEHALTVVNGALTSKKIVEDGIYQGNFVIELELDTGLDRRDAGPGFFSS